MSKFAPHHRSGSNNPRATSSTICQKCLGSGHFTYQCKSSTAPYVSRPSRTAQLENPRVIAKLRADGKPSVEVPEEFKTRKGTANRILEEKEKERESASKEKGKEKDRDPPKKRAKRSHSSDSDKSSSGSDSDSSSSSDSDSDSSHSSSGSSGSSRRRHKKRVPRRRGTSSVDSSEDEKDGERGRSSKR